MTFTKKQTNYIQKGNTSLNIAIGATGAGKTYADILFRLPNRLRAIKENGYHGIVLICGYSLETIEDNILNPMRELWGNKLVPEYVKNSTKIKLFGVPVRLVGASLDKRVNILRGKNVVYAYCDEVVTYSEKFFFMLLSRMRVSDSNGNLVSKIDATCNPENSTHWFKQKILDNENIKKHVEKFTIFDNDFISKEFIENLISQYKGTVYYPRNIMGEWANAEGLAFKMFADSLLKDSPMYGKFDLVGEYKYIEIGIGVDFGQVAGKNIYTATGLCRTENGYELHALDEFSVYGDTVDTEMIISGHYNFYRRVLLTYASSKIQQSDCDHYTSVIKSMRAYHAKNGSGHYIDKADKTSISLNEYVLKLTALLNLGKIKVSEKCPRLRDAFATLLTDPDTGGIQDNNELINDSYDSFRYSINRFLKNKALNII